MVLNWERNVKETKKKRERKGYNISESTEGKVKSIKWFLKELSDEAPDYGPDRKCKRNRKAQYVT